MCVAVVAYYFVFEYNKRHSFNFIDMSSPQNLQSKLVISTKNKNSIELKVQKSFSVLKGLGDKYHSRRAKLTMKKGERKRGASERERETHVE